jgi:signal transduction histidine kinase
LTLKTRLSILISVIFTVLYGLTVIFVFTQFSNFREEEFKQRLHEKLFSTLKLLVEVDEIDKNTLEIIDKNAINSLYNEKVFIFDDNYNILYKSKTTKDIHIDINDLKKIKTNKYVYTKKGLNEYLGEHYYARGEHYYGFIAAYDKYGKSKLNFLKVLLITSYLIFTIICWFLTTLIVTRSLKPLDNFYLDIKTINENNLNKMIATNFKNSAEINLLSSEFNLMLERIEKSYIYQKEFTALASHELKTPIARLMSQIENQRLRKDISEKDDNFLKNLLTDLDQLSGLIYSFLILSKMDNEQEKTYKEKVMLDDLIFTSFDFSRKHFQDPQINFEIENNLNIEKHLEFEGNSELLKIAFTNLIQNGIKYSNNNKIFIKVFLENKQLKIRFFNTGETIAEKDRSHIFDPFVRSYNSRRTSGLGLGLLIVKRILDYHKIKIEYQSTNATENIFELSFPH